MIINCNDLWSRMINLMRRAVGKPIVTNTTPRLKRR